jgi:cell division protein FtsA
VSREIITALDVGTSTVSTVVAEFPKGESNLRILGVGISSSRGVRRGTVVDLEDASAAIRESVAEASQRSGIPIRSVWLGIGGAHISVSSSKGVVAVSRADGEISQEDTRRAIAAAETFLPKNPNREVLHIIARDFHVDNESGIKDPVGMHGVRLEADTLVIECSSSFLKNLFKCVRLAGLSIEDYVFSPLAAAEAVLTKRQKELGTMLLDLGAGTSSFIVFEEGVPVHAGVIPVGGNNITNDIAVGMRTHVDIAEKIKLAMGSCLPDEASRKQSIRLAEFLEERVLSENSTPPRAGQKSPRAEFTDANSPRELATIIKARIQDIFELLQKELRKVNKLQLLPAGIVFIGGASELGGITELTRREMKLPAEYAKLAPGIPDIADPRALPPLAVALGVLKWAEMKHEYITTNWHAEMTRHIKGSRWLKWLKSLIP